MTSRVPNTWANASYPRTATATVRHDYCALEIRSHYFCCFEPLLATTASSPCSSYHLSPSPFLLNDPLLSSATMQSYRRQCFQ